MPSLADKEMEEQLTAVGNTLLQLPSLPDELLPLLDKIEELLQKVEQSPSRSMQTALSPLMQALVLEELLKHSDVDVKVGVASCISEIIRITAPEASYDDDKLKDVFQLIVSLFENLSDTSSRSYDKRTTILETMAKVRSCVIMLDLECDQMIIEMFHHFFKATRVNHAEVVFGSMEAIMTLVLEESEDISPDLLIPILDTLKMNNKDVMPLAKNLAERVIQNSADRVRPYLVQSVKKLNADLGDFGKVVALVCRENTDIVGNSNESISRDQPVVERKSTSASPARNHVTKVAKDAGEIMTDANSRKTDPIDHVDAMSVFKIVYDDCSAQNPVKSEAKAGNSEAEEVTCNHEITSKDVLISPTKAKPVEAAEPLDKVEDTTSQLSPSQEPENEAADVKSPTQSGSLCDESPSKKESSAKDENLNIEETLFVDTTSNKASEGESIPNSKLLHKWKKQSGETTVKDQALTEDGAFKNDEGTTSDSEARSLNKTKNLEDAVFKKLSEGESISKLKKLSQKGKKQSDEIIDKDQALTEEGASKNDEGSTSDSEARSLNLTKNHRDAVFKKASEAESISKSKKLTQKGKRQSDEDQALTEEGASKNDDCSTRDSEARPINQTEKLDVASKKATAGESSSKAKKQREKGKRQSDKTTNEDQTLTEECASKNAEGNTSDSQAILRSLNPTKKRGGAASKAKKQQQKGKRRSDETIDKDTILTEEGASKNDEGSTSDSEKRSRDKMEKLKDIISKKASEGESISIVKKHWKKGKKRSAQTTDKYSALTEEGASKNDESNTSDSEARLLGPMEKLGGANNKMEDGSSMSKSKVTSPRSPLKSLKDDDVQEQTPKMSLKRKRTPGTEKSSDTIEYGENLVGSKVKVWWPKDRMYYEGEIASFDSVKKKHKVCYTDGEKEVLNLKRERWEFVGDDSVSDEDAGVEHSSNDTSSDVQRKKKKGNTNSQSSKSSKRQKTYGSPKSKLKSGGKSKDDGKPESEYKVNNSKPSRNSVDNASIKPRDQPPRLGAKSQGDSAKASGGNRSKDNPAKTPSLPAKQDSQRSAAKSKGKTTPQSGKPLTKTSSSSKVKESGKSPTKTSSSSKVKKTESTSGKKQKR